MAHAGLSQEAWCEQTCPLRAALPHLDGASPLPASNSWKQAAGGSDRSDFFLNFIISHPARPFFSHSCSLPRFQGLFQALTAFGQGSCESPSPSSFGSHQCPLLFLLSFQLNPENFVPCRSGDMGPKCSPTLTALLSCEPHAAVALPVVPVNLVTHRTPRRSPPFCTLLCSLHEARQKTTSPPSTSPGCHTLWSDKALTFAPQLHHGGLLRLTGTLDFFFPFKVHLWLVR